MPRAVNRDGKMPSRGKELVMLRALPGGRSRGLEAAPADTLAALQALEKKVLWLSTWMIHNANHLRPSLDGLQVGPPLVNLQLGQLEVYRDVVRSRLHQFSETFPGPCRVAFRSVRKCQRISQKWIAGRLGQQGFQFLSAIHVRKLCEV
jgi:hypothetical protein